MLRWSELHPYNAVHVLGLSRSLDPARLQAAIGRQLEFSGPTGLVMDRRRRRFQYEGGPDSVALSLLQGGPEPLPAVCREIETQINTPFPREGRMNPFRFFAVEAGESFFLGLVYDHFIAGGDSILLLLKGILDLYRDPGAVQHPSAPPHLYPPTYRRLLLRYPAQALRGILVVPAMIASSRRCVRPRYSSPQDYHTGFACLRIEPPVFHAVIRTAKRWGARVNDVFIAALLQAISAFVPERQSAPRRRSIGVVSILNIREDFRLKASDAFGQFLASLQICHPVPDGLNFQQLVSEVHAETTRIKAQKRYLPGLALHGLANLLWPFLSLDRRHRFYQKYYPVWGGITNMNVNSLWQPAAEDSLPVSYLRAATTGPACPLVVAVTAVRDILHVAVTFRTAAFSRATVDSLTGKFAGCLAAL